MSTSPHIAELWVTVLVGVLFGLSPKVLETDSSNQLTHFLRPTSPKATEQPFTDFFFYLLLTKVYV